MTQATDMPPRGASLWTIAGLACALFGPLLMTTAPMQKLYVLAGSGLASVAVAQSTLWLVLAAALACHMFGDRLSLAAVGLVRPRIGSVLFGLAIGVSVYVGLYAIAFVLWKNGLFEAKTPAGQILQWPLWLRLLMLITAGVVEEALFRGFAIERLTALTGKRWLAALIALAAFVVAHLPFWGLGAVATPIVGGGFFTLVYLWRRDLIACMVAHLVVDSVGLLIAPALGITSSA
ncbi:MAG TPA: CPBP family intramembrane metalloprotease [Beijerinckiaceae bacterium]|nr:CPBP family intramembrane metalloprotease [Rhodoblastus sp.]HRY05134.1 CPBP family intramembrane metalloprotease [Beijerinckiaceae bacterium]